jgi:hypothetical protein
MTKDYYQFLEADDIITLEDEVYSRSLGCWMPSLRTGGFAGTHFMYRRKVKTVEKEEAPKKEEKAKQTPTVPTLPDLRYLHLCSNYGKVFVDNIIMLLESDRLLPPTTIVFDASYVARSLGWTYNADKWIKIEPRRKHGP